MTMDGTSMLQQRCAVVPCGARRLHRGADERLVEQHEHGRENGNPEQKAKTPVRRPHKGRAEEQEADTSGRASGTTVHRSSRLLRARSSSMLDGLGRK
jgi:hypothetical protein